MEPEMIDQKDLQVLPPRIPEFNGAVSRVGISIEGGCTTLCVAGARTWEDSEAMLQLQPDECAVVGRQEGGETEYLDPRFTPTQLVPNTGQSVLSQGGHGYDKSVSRGHFTLRGSGHGIVLLNGVPRRGGGVRPPLNGTIMLSPAYRYMGPGEEYLIEPGATVRIRLPNGAIVSLKAD